MVYESYRIKIIVEPPDRSTMVHITMPEVSRDHALSMPAIAEVVRLLEKSTPGEPPAPPKDEVSGS